MINILDDLIKRHPVLSICRNEIMDAYLILEQCFFNGNKLLICGNGGSASDADHIVGELMKSFKIERKLDNLLVEKIKSLDNEKGAMIVEKIQQGLPAIALHNHSSLNTAFLNDVENGKDYIYAQQLLGYGKASDVLLAISTSGNSTNVYNAALVAKAKGMKVIALTGNDGGVLKSIADISIVIPFKETYIIQEYHLPVYHCLCLMLEKRFFGK